jgi:pimeloyl-ACP methyl ester carboxylesterase
MEINKKMNFLIKNSKLKVIANSGHAPHIEQPKRLAQIINKFYGKLI